LFTYETGKTARGYRLQWLNGRSLQILTAMQVNSMYHQFTQNDSPNPPKCNQQATSAVVL